MVTSTVAEPGSTGPDEAADRGQDAPAHLLFVADSDRHQRAATSTWLEEELRRGAKIYYKGWLRHGHGPDRHWLSGPEGPRRGREAIASGQLEFCDFPTVIERCGGTTTGLHRLLTDEVTRAMDEGWPSVAMSQESARRPMGSDAEAAEFAEQERGYDVLIRSWPLRVLCQLTTTAENDAAVWESAAVHHGGVIDAGWSAEAGVPTAVTAGVVAGPRWAVRGELDAYAARRFGGALAGALRQARETRAGPHLLVDLARVEFMDVACAQMLALSARSAPSGQEIRVCGASRMTRRLLDAVERPRTLVVLDELPDEEDT